MTCWLCGFETTNLFTNPESPTCMNGPCHVCTAIAKVDEEINQATATLRRLLIKRCDLRSEQNRVHGSLVNRLPIELMNYIFGLLLPARDEWGRIGASNRVIMPLYLTSVSRGWRDIAWSNPLLWSSIHIWIGRQASQTSDRINFVREWILRSQTMPLTLHLDADNDNDELKGIIDAINQCSNRWHSLSLDITLKGLSALQHSTIKYYSLKRLRIKNKNARIDLPVPFLNTETSPEEVELSAISFQSLQVSWNHLSSAKLEWFTLDDIIQLFQNAPQMTCCRISTPRINSRHFPMPITHKRLETLDLHCGISTVLPGGMLLRSLTLPCLQEFGTDKMALLTPTLLPALVGRSSCPLTRITLCKILEREPLGIMQNLPGVTDLVLESPFMEYTDLEGLLLSEYFPDLCRLTLRLQPFLYLFEITAITLLLSGNWVANERRHRKILVIDPHRADGFSGLIWESEIGECLKVMPWNITLRKDGFELMVPRT